jgi:methionyl-tRNA synthetase
LPKNVPANEFLNLEGNKLSTSKNWAIWLHEYLIDFKDQQDSLRYALCASAPENKDTDFTWKEFQARNNNELVAILGNFVNRVVVLTNKYWDGVVPAIDITNKDDNQILSLLKISPTKIANSIKKFRFREALTEMMNLARAGNKYLADCEPWKVIKSDEKRAKTILNISLQITASLSIVSEPFLPFTSKKLKDILNLKNLKWADAGETMINSGHKINTGGHLFVKIEDDKIQKMIDKLNADKNEN